MARYIDAEKLKQTLTELYDLAKWKPRELHFSLFDMVANIDGELSADVMPVIHAHWIEKEDDPALCRCSHCRPAIRGKYNYFFSCTMWEYCPHCGAKMDEEPER